MKEDLISLFQTVLEKMGTGGAVPQVTVPENPDHGDYTTNVAMTLAKTLKKPPMDIALEVKRELEDMKKQVIHTIPDHSADQTDQTILAGIDKISVLRDIESIEVAPPGFVNVKISEARLISQVSGLLKQKEIVKTAQTEQRKTVMVEFAHPNTHKAFHIGHLRNITTGESIVRLLEATGQTVIRANYQGDVGMHIAKCLWAMTNLPDFNPQKVRGSDIDARVEFLGKAYAAGSKAYEESDDVKKAVGAINKKIYAKDSAILPLYQETRAWSLEYFEKIYQRVGSHFDRYYFESEVYESGRAIVLKGLEKGIFEKSDGAVIFPGEKFGLHNRVFISGEGNPTYEGKDMGLAPLQFAEYHPDLIIHCVGPEQAGYFQVVFEALAQMFPETRGKEFHLIYGWVRLKRGKMSSRTGNVILGEWLLDEAKKAVRAILVQSKVHYDAATEEEIAEKAAIAAVKYAFLRVSTRSDIAFDFAESVTFNGESGPYLQYTYARSKSVLRKAHDLGINFEADQVAGNTQTGELVPEERAVVRRLMYFPEVVAEAARTYSPNTLCAYLFQLAQEYNLFYTRQPIVKSGQAPFRLAMTAAVAETLKKGLYLLGIETIERM